MGAAFHERDTHVTAKCNVCFKGVNAAGEMRRFDIRRWGKWQAPAEGGGKRYTDGKEQVPGGSGEQRATEPRGQGQTAAAKQNGKHQAPSGKRQTTIDRTGRSAANGRRRAARNAT